MKKADAMGASAPRQHARPMTDPGHWLLAIEDAQRRIAGHVQRTSLCRADALSARFGVPIHLKLENHQTTGAFKLRGATNALLSLDDAARARGVTTASTGNHGRALAHAAQSTGTRCVVHLSSLVPANKIAALEAEGAEIRIVGASQDEAEDAARALADTGGLTYIPPFDHPDVIAGQGTIGLEILQDLPETELVLIPLSGGGLAAGIAAAIRAKHPETRIIGISMNRGAAMHASLAAGHPVPIREEATIADSLGGGIGLDNRYTFAMIRDLLDGTVLLTEDEIEAGIRAAAAEGEIVEGAGAVGLGAILAGKVALCGPTVAVLSGANVDPALHRRILAAKNA